MSSTTHEIFIPSWQTKAAQAKTLTKLLLPMAEYTDTDLTDSELDAGTAAQDGDGNWILWFPAKENIEEIQEFTLKAYPKGCNEGIVIPFKVGDLINLVERQLDTTLKPAEHWFTINNIRVKQVKDLRFGRSDSVFSVAQETSKNLFDFCWVIELDINPA